MPAWFWLPCLAVAGVAAGDERRHQRGQERRWGESWYFDFAAADLSIGGFVRLSLFPNLGVAWYWAALVGRGRRLVLVRDHEIELPRQAGLEVRGQGLWSAVSCETPLDHWSIGLEAFAVALDDPLEAFRGERGDLVCLGFDLEWEARAAAAAVGDNAVGDGHYEQSCDAYGEILFGDERLAFEGAGQRAHTWGVADWWGGSRAWAAGLLSDGTSFTSMSGISADVGPAGLPLTAAVSIGDLSLTASPVAHAPLLVEAADGRTSRLVRTLCRYRADDGREGGGWMELLQPPEHA